MKVIFYNIFGLGHINPTLPLVAALVKTGAKVIYHSSPERKELIEQTGAEFRNYGRDDYKAADYHPGKNFVLQTLQATMGLLPFLTEEIEVEKPDLLIYDSMAPWGKVLSHIHKLPAICSVTTLPLTREQKQKTFRMHGVAPDELNKEILLKLSLDFNLELDFDCVLGAYTNCNFVYSAEGISSQPEFSSKSFHYLGSPKRTEDLGDFPFELFQQTNRKVITMALGTLLPDEHPEVLEWYRSLLKAFSSDQRFYLILATGNQHILEQLGPLAPNVIARKKIPQQEILKFTDVFIHHGGMNSMSEGMSAGVPMIIIPHSKDQFANAELVQTQETGLVIPKVELTSERLRRDVLNLMFSPKIKRRVESLKQKFHIPHPEQRALTLIQERVT